MADRIVKVLEITEAEGNEGNVFKKVKLQPDSGKPFTTGIFKPDIYNALSVGKWYRLDMERNTKGYWQVNSVGEEVPEGTRSPDSGSRPPAPSPQASGLEILGRGMNTCMMATGEIVKTAIENDKLNDIGAFAVALFDELAEAWKRQFKSAPKTAETKTTKAPSVEEPGSIGEINSKPGVLNYYLKHHGLSKSQIEAKLPDGLNYDQATVGDLKEAAKTASQKK